MGSSQPIRKGSGNPSEYATRVNDPQLLQDPSQWKAYDFIIVGGGTAGCVLASRLSENPNFSVLVLEAGDSHEGNMISAIPFAFNLNFHTAADWDFRLSPQKGLNGRQDHYARGKMLGGSSSINAMIYHHSAPEDFDSWARDGAEGWSYKDLRPYFLKSEGCSLKPDQDGEYGTSGPLKTRRDANNKINEVMIKTCKNLGIPTMKDLNTNGTLGAGPFVGAVNEKGARSSTAVSYFTPDVIQRPNLKVAVNCRVEKILFDKSSDGTHPRAIGVEFRRQRDGPLFRVASRKEVLLCGGAVSSPHVLLLSGLGPQGELEKHGVPVVKHLPSVGKNFADHIACGSMNFQAKAGHTYDYLNNPFYGLFALLRWRLTGKGPLSDLASPGAAFIRSDDPCIPVTDTHETLEDTSSGPNAPDIEIVWIPLAAVDNGQTKTSSAIKAVTLSAIAVRPKSVGEISLATNNAWDSPIIDANFLDDEHDVKVLLRGARLCLKLAHTEPLASILQLDPKPKHRFFWPGCADPEKVTDEELIQWIRNNAATPWHPSSSCRMGLSEISSVVNTRLQVHGVESLRVIDASIFPTLVSGHPCGPVVATAEKASDMIKEQYNA